MSAKPKKKPVEPVASGFLEPGADGKYVVNDKLTRLDLAFPANVRHLMPDPRTLPERSRFDSLVSRWFFSGLPTGTDFKPRPGIDAGKALAHVKCILGSFEPKHEHKEAAVAFLLDHWFEDIVVPGASK